VPGHMVYATGSDPGVLIMANWPAREDSAVATMNVYTSQAECSLDPTDIDFGSLDLGEETLRQLTITNTGSDLLAGDVPASCGVFEIVAGSGPFSLAGGQSHEVTIRFAPEQEGLFSCQLDLGNGICSLVPINGIGHQEPVGTAADPPDARAVAGGVLLHWHYSQGTFDGFLVYRRPAGESARRLTEQPLAGWNGEMEYLDATDGIAPGTLVFYSYGMVRAGQEIGRSGEVSARTNGVPPASMALHPVFPNPFNPVTHISFDLEGPGPVRLEIYDVSGQRIRVLLDEPLPGGSHARQWDGRDNEGRRVPSGAYYCRLTSGRLTAFQKMLLIK
jgi:hypothetical protein